MPGINDFDQALHELEGDGQYIQEIGDIMMQIMASYFGVPAILLSIDTNSVEFILPERIFNGVTKSQTPIVLVRQDDHFEVLILPPNQVERAIYLVNQERRNRHGIAEGLHHGHMACPIQNSKPQKNYKKMSHQDPSLNQWSPSQVMDMNKSNGVQDSSMIDDSLEDEEISFNFSKIAKDLVNQERKSRQGIVACDSIHISTSKKNNKKILDQDSSQNQSITEDSIINNLNSSYVGAEKIYKLHDKVFDRDFGRRKIIHEQILKQTQYQPMEKMYSIMDPILQKLPILLEQRRKYSTICEKIMEDYFKTKEQTQLRQKYRSFNIEVADDTSTPQNVIFAARKYIFPWIIVHLEEVYNSSLYDLLNLEKKIYLNENAISENINSHKITSPETDKSILNAWKHFCEAIVSYGRKSVGITGGPHKGPCQDAVTQATYHYAALSKFCTSIQYVASKTSKIDRHNRQTKSKKLPAMDEVIKGWLQSKERHNLINKLEATVKSLSPNIAIKRELFATLTEFVAMELIIYGTVRAGAYLRMKLKTLRRLRPMWQHQNRITDNFQLPDNACQHQKKNNGKTLTMMGITGSSGLHCCQYYIAPIAYGIANLSDKGAQHKKTSIIIIPLQPFEWLNMYILIRKSFFAKKRMYLTLLLKPIKMLKYF